MPSFERLSRRAGPAGLAALAALLLASPAMAAWQATRVSGLVWVVHGTRSHERLARGMTVEDGATVYATDTGRAMLARGAESMMVGPGTVMAVQRVPTPGMTTTVLQRSGSVEFEVAHLDHPHFNVETPYLAAVVKGTHFTMRVAGPEAGGGADVAVRRGTVQATDIATGQTAPVRGGQRASTGQAGGHGLSLSGTGTLAAVRDGVPRTPVVRAAAVPGTSAAQRSYTSGTTETSTAGAASSESASSGSDNRGRGENSAANYQGGTRRTSVSHASMSGASTGSGTTSSGSSPAAAQGTGMGPGTPASTGGSTDQATSQSTGDAPSAAAGPQTSSAPSTSSSGDQAPGNQTSSNRTSGSQAAGSEQPSGQGVGRQAGSQGQHGIGISVTTDGHHVTGVHVGRTSSSGVTVSVSNGTSSRSWRR